MARDTKTWRCGKFTLTFDRPRIMGVLNVTPDSFSDGGKDADTDAAIARGMEMLDQGANIIDVGGESTRPGFTPVNADEEAKRVLPVVKALVQAGAIVSIDTRHVEVAKAAVRMGAAIVNDVTGFTDPKMLEFVASSNCGVIVVHTGEVSEPERAHKLVELDTSAAAFVAERTREEAEGRAPRGRLARAHITEKAARVPNTSHAATEEKPAAARGRKKQNKQVFAGGVVQQQLPFSDIPTPTSLSARTHDETASISAAPEDFQEGVTKVTKRSRKYTQIDEEAFENAATVDVSSDETQTTTTAKEQGDAFSSVSESKDTPIDLPATDELQAIMQRAAARAVAGSRSRRVTLPDSAPIMRRVMGFLSDQARTLMRAGVERERIAIDPGAGFGKSAEEDLVIQRETSKIFSLGYPVVCAVSRKRFVGAISGVTAPADRDSATFGVCLAAVEQGAGVVRVHDVAGFAQLMNGYWAIAHHEARRAFVGLGSNLGRRLDNIRAARDLIDEIPLTCVFNCSRIYESEPAYDTHQEAFANAVIEVRTELAPEVLLDELLAIEDKLHRNRTKSARPNGPRTIDCDLLWMDGEVHGGNKLRLPHPKMGERDFVLVPLEDLTHDPARFLRYEGVRVLEPEERVGHVVGELGQL